MEGQLENSVTSGLSLDLMVMSNELVEVLQVSPVVLFKDSFPWELTVIGCSECGVLVTL